MDAITGKRRTLILEAVVVAFVVLLFYYPLCNPGTMMSGGDGANLFWPIKILTQRAILDQGVVPLWNPYAYLGTPLAASLQHAVYYPPGWLVYILPPAHFGLKLGNLLHLVLAGVGCWAWLRVGFSLHRVSAISLGAAFPCIAWFWGHQDHINQIGTTSYLPLIALLNWLYLRGRMRPLVFVSSYSILSAFQFLAGHPQEAFYTHLFCVFLFAARFVFRRHEKPRFLSALGVYAAAGLIGGLLIAVQLLPMLELKSYSRRQFDDPAYPLSLSMPPDVLVTYLSPHWFGSFRDGFFVEDETGSIALDEAGNLVWDRRAYGEYGLFVGVPILLLFIVAPFLRRDKRRFYAFLCLVIILSLIMAMGGNTDPARLTSGEFTEFPAPGFSFYDLFLKIAPFASGFRVPARIVILAAFCLVTGAAFGLDGLLRKIDDPRRSLAAGVVIGLAILLSLHLPSRREKFHYQVEAPELSLYREANPVDNPSPGRMYRLTNADDQHLVKERHLEMMLQGGNPILIRYLALQPHMNAIEGVYIVDGYEEGLLPTARFKDFTFEFNRNLRQFSPDADLLALMGVEVIYTDLPVNPEAFPVDGQSDLGWPRHENPRFRGTAFWLDAAQGINLKRLDGPVHRSGQVLRGYKTEAVDYGSMPEWDGDWLALSTTYETMNSIRIDVANQPVESPLAYSQEALLVLGWFPGWYFESQPDVKASRTEVEFANAIHARLPTFNWTARELMGADTQAFWRIRYEPFSYRAGLFLSALGLAAWIGLLGFLFSSRRNDP